MGEPTKKLFDKNNEELLKKMIPEKSEPIFCNSVLNPNDEIYNLSFKEIAKNRLNEILDEQEFDLELEQIKHNLNIK